MFWCWGGCAGRGRRVEKLVDFVLNIEYSTTLRYKPHGGFPGISFPLVTIPLPHYTYSSLPAEYCIPKNDLESE